MRHHLSIRRTTRTTVLGAAALLAALTLTACQEGADAAADDSGSQPAATADAATGATDSGTADSGAADSAKGTGKAASGSASGSATASGSGSDSGSGSGSGSEPNSATAGSAGRQSSGRGEAEDTGPVTRACDGGNTKVTIAPVTRPVNHMLLTVTNTGSTACNAYSYPYLRFGEAQAVPQVYEESRPQAVVTLGPGESGYAGVMTASADGSGTGGYSTRSLTVSFQGRQGSGSAGPSANVPLGKAVYVDSTLTVTYWQTGADDALMY